LGPGTSDSGHGDVDRGARTKHCRAIGPRGGRGVSARRNSLT
jgi:hypothetical protein